MPNKTIKEAELKLAKNKFKNKKVNLEDLKKNIEEKSNNQNILKCTQ